MFAAAPLGPVHFLSPDQESGIHYLIIRGIQLLTPNNLGETWRCICSLDIRSVSALEVSLNRALQIDIYFLAYLLSDWRNGCCRSWCQLAADRWAQQLCVTFSVCVSVCLCVYVCVQVCMWYLSVYACCVFLVEHFSQSLLLLLLIKEWHGNCYHGNDMFTMVISVVMGKNSANVTAVMGSTAMVMPQPSVSKPAVTPWELMHLVRQTTWKTLKS